MINHVGSCLCFYEDKLLMDTPPPALLTIFPERSTNFRTNLLAIVRNIALEKNACPRGTSCPNFAILHAKAASFVAKFDGLSGHQRSILQIIHAMIPIAAVEEVFHSGFCSLPHAPANNNILHAKYLPFSETIRQQLPGWTERQTSVCLECLQSSSLTEKTCKHEGVDAFAQLDRLYGPVGSC